PHELRRGSLRAWDARLLQRRECAIVGVLEPLQLDPLARDAVEQDRIGDVPLLRERDELPYRDVERRREREAERAALVQQRRHRDLPAPADLAEEVLLRHLNISEED